MLLGGMQWLELMMTAVHEEGKTSVKEIIDHDEEGMVGEWEPSTGRRSGGGIQRAAIRRAATGLILDVDEHRTQQW